MSETYISVDVETDGPCPGRNSMLSLGAAAFLESGKLVDTFCANLEEHPGASRDPKTMEWWGKNKKAWDNLMVDRKRPSEVMVYFDNWLKRFHKPVFVAYPAGFDFTFIYWYFHEYVGSCPFGFSAFDLKTAGMLLSNQKYFRDSTKRNFPPSWFVGVNHDHTALVDAIGQGKMFFNMMKESGHK